MPTGHMHPYEPARSSVGPASPSGATGTATRLLPNTGTVTGRRADPSQWRNGSNPKGGVACRLSTEIHTSPGPSAATAGDRKPYLTRIPRSGVMAVHEEPSQWLTSTATRAPRPGGEF